MSEWHFMDPASRGNVIEAWEREAAGMMDLAADDLWEGPTGAGEWQVRDVFAHLVETTRGYFISFDAARGAGPEPENRGLRNMSRLVDEGARAFRGRSREEMVSMLGEDLARMRRIADDLTDEEWGSLMVPHKYMGPLPAAFYPIFQVVDYTVHSWDIREGTDRGHMLDGDSADLLAPLAFIVWQSTPDVPPDTEPYQLGIRVTGRNAGDHVVSVSPEGIGVEQGEIDGLPAVMEFDPGTLVLTAFGRINGGTVRGDTAVAERFLNSFFRI